MKNVLRETIEMTLSDVHIETGRKDEFERVVNALEAAISEKIISHEVDFYSESMKV